MVKKNKSLEELLVETEQKILNNEFHKVFTLSYDGEDYDFILKPISQNKFLNIYERTQNDIESLTRQIIEECLIDNEGNNYPSNLIDILLNEMPAGFVVDVTEKVYEISGIETDEKALDAARSFLERES